jgi:hypothetical protein
MAKNYNEWKTALVAERAYTDDYEGGSTPEPERIHHDEYDHQGGEKPTRGTARKTAKHVAAGAALGTAGTVAAGLAAAHHVLKNPHLKDAAKSLYKHYTGQQHESRARSILEWFDTYGVKKEHSVRANAHYAQAHRKAHQAAHTEANRAAKEAGDKAWYATEGSRKEKKTAAHNAAGRAYHSAYGRTYGDIHAGMLRTLGRSKSPQKVLPSKQSVAAVETETSTSTNKQ